MHISRVLLSFMLVGCMSLAQKLVSPLEVGPNLPARPISQTDLLAITVYGAPELSRSVRVTEDGLIRLPMLTAKISAKGLMPAELETRLAEALMAEHILVDPVVSVNIAQYGSRPVSVAGAVRHPLTFETHERITLLDALARAEGFSPEAGTELLVTRPASKENPKPLVERVLVRELIEGANPAANLSLYGGEEVRVPESGRVFVVGNIKKPGAFRIDPATTMTILQALALSEGLAPFSTKEAYIYRPADGGAKQEIEVALRKIMERKSPDVKLQSGEIGRAHV